MPNRNSDRIDYSAGGAGDYRILDKDLGRISNLETARLQATRPLLRLGAAAVFIAAIVVLTVGFLGGHSGLAMLAACVAVGCYLAMSIGSNDVANALAPAYAAGAIGLGAGLSLMAAAEIAGALLAGQPVTQRMATGIIDLPAVGSGAISAQVMLAALLAAALWISAASWHSIPVSTTHSVVGAISGAGLAAFGAEAVHWSSLGVIAASWIIAPLFSGLVAALILGFLRARAGQNERVTVGRQFLPVLIGVMAALFTVYLIGLVLRLGLGTTLAGALVVGLFAWWRSRRRIDNEIRQQSREQVALKRLMAGPLLWAATLLAFAHGANDVGNIAGPLVIVAQGLGFEDIKLARGSLVLLATGCGIALGAVLFGRGLVRMVGGGITRLNPVRALCITLATATTVLIASFVALPISTTHVAVGGVFGVGFYREWQDTRMNRIRAPFPAEERSRRLLIRRSYVMTILGAWIVTLPITAALAAILFSGLRRLIAV